MFSGTPTEFGLYTVSVMAIDPWGANTTMTFKIMAGVKPNTPPVNIQLMPNQEAYFNQLLNLKLNLTSYFRDPDGDKLFFVVTKTDGDYLPEWLTYEEITQTISGIARQNTTDIDIVVMVTADDRRGGSTFQTFTLKVVEYTGNRNLIPLLIVAGLILLFIIVLILVMCIKNVKCKQCCKKSKNEEDDFSDDSSIDEDDDICIEDVKPKNPF